MKKELMTTSALVAAGMFGLASQADAQMMRKPNPVQLKVGGYMEQFVGYAFRDATFATGVPVGQVDQQTEAEIHFTGSGKLDNGLQIVAHVEYEVTGSPGNIIDEQTLTLRNGFGQVILGNEDPVASLMTTGYITTFVTNAGGSLTYDVTPWIPIPVGFTQGSPVAGALTDPKLEVVRQRREQDHLCLAAYRRVPGRCELRARIEPAAPERRGRQYRPWPAGARRRRR